MRRVVKSSDRVTDGRLSPCCVTLRLSLFSCKLGTILGTTTRTVVKVQTYKCLKTLNVGLGPQLVLIKFYLFI